MRYPRYSSINCAVSYHPTRRITTRLLFMGWSDFADRTDLLVEFTDRQDIRVGHCPLRKTLLLYK